VQHLTAARAAARAGLSAAGGGVKLSRQDKDFTGVCGSTEQRQRSSSSSLSIAFRHAGSMCMLFVLSGTQLCA
jgi:hypothetical protein